MAVSFEFLRAVLAIIGVACAYMAGRSLVAVRKGWQKVSHLYGWLIRATVCVTAIVFRHSVDTMAMAAWGLAAAAFGTAYWQALHRKPPEDLSHEIVPHDSMFQSRSEPEIKN